MSIYFNTELSQHINIQSLASDPTIAAHERIGAVFQRGLDTLLSQDSALPPSERGSFLELVGVNPLDRAAVEELLRLLPLLKEPDLQVTHLENSSGTFFIRRCGESTPIAVFKIGRKRAAMELLARRLAHLLQLEKHVISGMFCTLFNPPPHAEPMIEELWNGLTKEYLTSYADRKTGSSHATSRCEEEEEEEEGMTTACEAFATTMAHAETAEDVDDEDNESWASDPIPPDPLTEQFYRGLQLEEEEDDALSPTSHRALLASAFEQDEAPAYTTAQAVVGIVQPFLGRLPHASTYDYTCMVIVALAIGLRDGKHDGYFGSILFDTEDSFPRRVDPPWNKGDAQQTVSAFDLPFMDKDRRTHQSLSRAEVMQLASIVQSWNVFQIVQQICQQKILFEDPIAEQCNPQAIREDAGGCSFKVEEESPHLVNGHFIHISPSDPTYNATRSILLTEQLEACQLRLTRLKDYIMSRAREQKRFSPQDLLFAVDPFGRIFHDALTRSPTLTKEADQKLSMSGPHSLMGRYSPDSTGAELPDEPFNPYCSQSSEDEIATITAHSQQD